MKNRVIAILEKIDLWANNLPIENKPGIKMFIFIAWFAFVFYLIGYVM